MMSLIMGWLCSWIFPATCWKGAELNIQDEDGDTALLIAAELASPDVVLLLLDAGIYKIRY